MEALCSLVATIVVTGVLVVTGPSAGEWDFKENMFDSCLKQDSACVGETVRYYGHDLTITSVDTEVIPRSPIWVNLKSIRVEFQSNGAQIIINDDQFDQLTLID